VVGAEEMRSRASEALREAAHQLGELGEETAKKLKEEVDSLRQRLRRR
jgi:ElaB/YqjD/DUF883 family membrane-anchored ribosome-binding protein